MEQWTAANNFRTREEQPRCCCGGRVKFHVERPNRKWKKRWMAGRQDRERERKRRGREGIAEKERVHRKREKG